MAQPVFPETQDAYRTVYFKLLGDQSPIGPRHPDSGAGVQGDAQVEPRPKPIGAGAALRYPSCIDIQPGSPRWEP